MNESTKFMEEEEKKIRHFGLFGLSSVIYALFYTFCLYKNASGITYPFFTGGTLFYFFSFLKKSGISAKKDSAFYAVSIELLGISTFCTDNKNIILMNKCGIFILFFILFIHNFYQDKLWDIFKYFQAILQTILGSLHSFTRPVTDFKLYRKAEKTKDKNKMSGPAYIMIGLLISLPLLTVVLSLLSSADIVFRSFIKDFAFIDWLSENFIGLTFSILFSFFASYCISAYLEKRSIKEEVADKRTGEPLIAITFTAILSFIYLLFSGIQIIYLFAGNMQLPKPYTYAEYAREGFFQLLFVCLINLVLVFVCLGQREQSVKSYFNNNILMHLYYDCLQRYAHAFIYSILRPDLPALFCTLGSDRNIFPYDRYSYPYIQRNVSIIFILYHRCHRFIYCFFLQPPRLFYRQIQYRANVGKRKNRIRKTGL